MPFDAQNRFFHGLNPKRHFTIIRDANGNPSTDADPRKKYRVSSATFKYKPIEKKKWESSLDSEDRISLAEERARIAEKFPGYGIGSISYESISQSGAEVERKPEDDNEAHCALYATEEQIDDLVKPEHLKIIDWPTDPIP